MPTTYAKWRADARAESVLAGRQPGPTIGQASLANTSKSLDLGERFRTESRKIKDLILTVDQEVGGSNPPSCTSKINRLGKPGRFC
jgi:hypothetical protein